MAMHAFRLLFISSLLLAPILANAAACEDIIEQIKHDTTQYGEAITNQHLPWMCLKWLQQKMGTPIAKISDQQQTRYTWECNGSSDNKLTILIDNSGKLIQVDGQYSSERGAGFFSAPVNVTCLIKNTAATNTTTPAVAEPPTPSDTAANTTTACDSIAEQIYDVAAMSADHPYTHPPYSWEDKNWLEKNFGTPKTQTAANNTSYLWHCQNDAMTTVAYNAIQAGPHTQLTTLCKGSNCYLATVSRSNNALHGNLKIIAPKPL
jgi:hypothetical protein